MRPQLLSDPDVVEFMKTSELNGHTLHDYWVAPSSGPLRAEWDSAPHRLMYDLLNEVVRLRKHENRND